MFRKLPASWKRAAKSLLRKNGYVCYRVASQPYYLSECEDLLRFARDEPITTVFDVGANVGELALRFASYFPAARVFAFEPIPDTFEQLRGNTRAVANIVCVCSALGAEAGSRNVAIQENSALNSLVPANNEALRRDPTTREVQVQMDTVDQFSKERGLSRIDLLKSDTEGFDLEVLRGGARMFAERRVRFVLVECDFGDFAKRLSNFFELHRYLAGHGMHFLGLYDVRLSPPPEVPRIWYCNALFGL